MASNAELLFKDLRECPTPEAVIEKLRTSPENEYCECKSGSCDIKKGKEYWAEALSGFANTSGGVLIWGIDARERKGQRIFALDLDPDPEKRRVALDACILETLTPPLIGIDYSIVGGPQGLLICYIPEGLAKPYEGKHQYHMRTGHRFSNIPQGHLRMLFYPQTKSRLAMEISIGGAPLPEGGLAAQYNGVIMNGGNASAIDLFCAASVSPPFEWKFPEGPWTPSREYHVPSAAFTRPVHPGAAIPFGLVSLGRALDNGTIIQREHEQHTEFHFHVYARDQAALRGKIVFEPEDIKVGSKKAVVLDPLVRDW